MAAAAARAGGDEPIVDNQPTYNGKLRQAYMWVSGCEKSKRLLAGRVAVNKN